LLDKNTKTYYQLNVKNDIKIIRAEFRCSEEARYIHRLHGVLLVLLGLSTVKAGEFLGDPQRTIAHWVAQFKMHGLDGLRDAEKAGRPGTLTEAQRVAVTKALSKPPKESGFDADSWTNAILASLLKKRYGITLSIRQCSRLIIALKNQTKS
jgi:transposase